MEICQNQFSPFALRCRYSVKKNRNFRELISLIEFSPVKRYMQFFYRVIRTSENFTTISKSLGTQTSKAFVSQWSAPQWSFRFDIIFICPFLRIRNSEPRFQNDRFVHAKSAIFDNNITFIIRVFQFFITIRLFGIDINSYVW